MVSIKVEARSYGTSGMEGTRPGITLRLWGYSEDLRQFLTLGFGDTMITSSDRENKTKAPQVLKIRRVPVEHSIKKEEKKYSHVHQPGTTINPQRALKTARESALAEITEAYSASLDTTQPKIK